MQTTQDLRASLNAMKAALAGGNVNYNDPGFRKAINVALGIVNYDLEEGAKLLFPWGAKVTPMRNEIARRKSNRGDTAHRWKQITAINSTKLPPGVSEGNRSGVVTTVLANRTANYAGLGLEDYVTEEARYAAEGFDDVLSLASENLLKAVMIVEEKMIAGGNSAVNLGTPATPTLSTATTGGALSNGTFYVGVVALSVDGWDRATLATGVVQQIVRTNADGSTDTINGGTSQPSAVANTTLSGGGAAQTLGMTCAAITGAVAYAWYIGTAANHQYLQAITTINSYNLTGAVPANTRQDFQTLAATDYSSVGTYAFDGLLYGGPFAGSTTSYFVSLATGTVGTGTQLTTDNSGGIKEINTALQDRWDNYRLSFDTMWCNSQELISLKVLIVKNGGAPLVRFVSDMDKPMADITAGATVGWYLNPITQELIRVRVHPFIPPGTILFTTREAPYAQSRVSTLIEMLCRQEYYSTLWPMKTRKREYGVYVDEVLLNYFPAAFGAITNIAPTLS